MTRGAPSRSSRHVLDIATVDQSCPRFSDVHQTAIEADAMIRAANPNLSARELGTLIHQEIRDQIRTWPEIDVGIWSEQGSLLGIGNKKPFLASGSVRFDVTKMLAKAQFASTIPKQATRTCGQNKCTNTGKKHCCSAQEPSAFMLFRSTQRDKYGQRKGNAGGPGSVTH
jgi:hypothetical protein